MGIALFLIRHAHSVPIGRGGIDFNRALSPKGAEDIKRLSNEIKTNKLEKECSVFCSPAKRTVETFRLLKANSAISGDGVFHIKEELYTGNNSDCYKNTISSFSPKIKTVLIIGHNPGLASFISYLWPQFPGRFPSCSYIHISSSSWASLLEFQFKIERVIFNPRKKTLEMEILRLLKPI